MTALDVLAGEIAAALDALTVPVFVIDLDGYLIYGNAAALDRFGKLSGNRFTTYLAPESVTRVRDSFTRKILGTERASERDVVVIDKHGVAIPAEISAVSLEREGRVVGVFGLVDIRDVGRPATTPPGVSLTPRQAEVLQHLSAGGTTKQMALLMGVEPATVRNHVRDLLKRLGAHSRLEAVIRAHELGLTETGTTQA